MHSIAIFWVSSIKSGTKSKRQKMHSWKLWTRCPYFGLRGLSLAHLSLKQKDRYLTNWRTTGCSISTLPVFTSTYSRRKFRLAWMLPCLNPSQALSIWGTRLPMAATKLKSMTLPLIGLKIYSSLTPIGTRISICTQTYFTSRKTLESWPT